MTLLWFVLGMTGLIVVTSLGAFFLIRPGRELGGALVDGEGRFAFHYAAPAKPLRLFMKMRVDYDGTGDAVDLVVAWQLQAPGTPPVGDAVQLGLLPNPKARRVPGRRYGMMKTRTPGNHNRVRGIELLARNLAGPPGSDVQIAGQVSAGPNTRWEELRVFVAR